MKPSELKPRYELAQRIARAAGELTLKYFQRDDLAVEIKSDDSPVTIADRAAELLLRAEIARAFPQDAILGEEFGEQPGASGFRWILDPIDGTKSFISGVPLYGALLGVEFEGNSLIGVIDIPALRENIHACVGEGAWHTRADAPPARAHVSSRSKLAEALFCTSEVATFSQASRQTEYLRLQKACRITRTWGDCYGYLLVATGRAELMVDPIMNVWDAAAILPILTEAGGTFTDWQGTPTIHSGEGIATNGHVLQEVLAITRG